MGCLSGMERVEEETEAVASVDILEEVGSGSDTGRDAVVDGGAAAWDVASVNLDGKAEKAREGVLMIIPEARKVRDTVPFEVLYLFSSQSARQGPMTRAGQQGNYRAPGSELRSVRCPFRLYLGLAPKAPPLQLDKFR